ncbi:hypothetical protein [Rudaeicoccus suwonensis]|uniref:hypothetical protein n=1 Tax=Rudaeicoccus suwonensis TaxID=657409 RepID=UPI0011A736DF|nr:hypothetical protein [Rudaeicoccus suwonensis]
MDVLIAMNVLIRNSPDRKFHLMHGAMAAAGSGASKSAVPAAQSMRCNGLRGSHRLLVLI